MDEQKKENIFDSFNLLVFIYQKKLHITIACLIAAIVSIVVGFCIPPKYKSVVVLYPTTSTSVAQNLASENTTQKGLLNFGEDEEVEQLMQVLQSSEIRNRIIEKYDLVNHYRIPSNTKYLYTTLTKKFKNNVKISRTEYSSIKIEVLDRNPDTAAYIANDISILVDTVYSKMQKTRAEKAFKIAEQEYIEQLNKVQEIRDSLETLSNLGVIDVRSQTEMYSEQHAIALAKGNNSAASEIEKKLDDLAKYGTSQTILKEQLTEEVKTLTLRKNKFREAKIELEQDLPNVFIVNKAEVPERKAQPQITLIVIISVIATFILATLALIISENLKKKIQVPRSRINLKKLKINYELPSYSIMESYFKTTSIFNLIAKWKWHILIITIVGGVLGAVFSGPTFIHPKFKSQATLYPANVICFSDESESEQMLEILQSSDIKFGVIEKFDLYNHYRIDPNDKSATAKLLKIYDKNIFVEKTQNDAINVTAVDEDPQIAADIANEIISEFNDKMLSLNKEKSLEQYNIYSNELINEQKEIDSLIKVLSNYGNEMGMINFDAQIKKYTEAIALGKNLDEARKVLGNWKSFGAEYLKTDSLLFVTLKWYAKDKRVAQESLRDANKQQTFAHIVSKPFPSDKKFYPVRWLIVLFSMLGACLIGTITIAIVEGCKKSK